MLGRGSYHNTGLYYRNFPFFRARRATIILLRAAALVKQRGQLLDIFDYISRCELFSRR